MKTCREAQLRLWPLALHGACKWPVHHLVWFFCPVQDEYRLVQERIMPARQAGPCGSWPAAAQEALAADRPYNAPSVDCPASSCQRESGCLTFGSTSVQPLLGSHSRMPCTAAHRRYESAGAGTPQAGAEACLFLWRLTSTVWSRCCIQSWGSLGQAATAPVLAVLLAGIVWRQWPCHQGQSARGCAPLPAHALPGAGAAQRSAAPRSLQGAAGLSRPSAHSMTGPRRLS